MYRIMLADDEGIVLNSLKIIIDREFPGQCHVETARTGRDVIELAESFRPDIAVMDIQMPGINGIEAIREIRKTNPLTEVIILSAYDRFDYAKEAINLGVSEYVNKPFNQNTIREVLDKTFKKIDSKRKKRSDDLIIWEKMETAAPIIENAFIYSLMFRTGTADDAENYRNLLGLSGDYGCMFALYMEDKDQGAQTDLGSGEAVSGISYIRVREILKESFDCVVGSVIYDKIPVLIPMAKPKLEYEERVNMIDSCRELARRLKRSTGISFRIGIGSVRKLYDCRDSYEDALKALSASDAGVAHTDDLPIQCMYDEEYPIDLENELFDRMRNGLREECEHAAAKYFDWMLENYDERNISVRLKTLEFVLWAEHEAYLNGGLVYHFTDRDDYFTLVYNAERNSDLKPWFVRKFGDACTNMRTRKEEHENELVEKALSYIRANFDRDLSLDDVSRQLDLSPYYFSRLFKDETGTNFLEFITSLRIEKAKKLLAEDDCSMKEICVEVGYSDPNYFSRIFKKNTGMTPTEYRERSGI